MKRFYWLSLSVLATAALALVLFRTPPRTSIASPQIAPSYPILFVTQVPVTADFTTIGSTFGNHLASTNSATRGGDLWIRYPDGSLKNLTQLAGYGTEGFQGANSIAVRDPAVHWDGSKAVFSMVIGSATQQYQVNTYYWQLYEITGLGQADTPVITKVPNQPTDFNNVSPIYGTDGRIIFTTDRPRNGARHLYPQLDEYELAPVVTGLWSLDPATGDLQLLNHAPSGDFTPTIDSYGRVIFTQWDHLQRDQQADADANYGTGQNCDSGPYGTFNYSDESATAQVLPRQEEHFPEPRSCRGDLLAGTNLEGHEFNHFFPWMIREDGTDSEILNHLGRHELHSYIPRTFTNDPNIQEYYGQYNRYNPNYILNFFQIKESPTTPGLYFGVDAAEFGTHASGQIVSIYAPPLRHADQISVTYITHRETFGTTPSANHSGMYREPLPLANGELIAVHSSFIGQENGTYPNGASYNFRLKTVTLGGNGYWTADQPLTPGISKTISYWSPDQMVNFSGTLWELNPVEVRPRPIPTAAPHTLPAPEQAIFDQAGVNVAAFQEYLRQNNLALLVVRDATTRDDFDFQQPLNLRVPGGVQNMAGPGTVYDVTHMQLFRGDQLRGWTGGYDTEINPGRRVLARPLYGAPNPPLNNAPLGSVLIAADGSVAALVPAQRALTWQLTDSAGTGIVRERYWVTFQPGEIRMCTSCHGPSEFDQAGNLPPTNEPQALLELLEYWQLLQSLDPQGYLPLVNR